MNNIGTGIAIRRHDPDELYIIENICFCKENPEVVLEKLILSYKVDMYKNILIHHSNSLKGPVLLVFQINIDKFNSMELIDSIDEIIDNDSRFEECKTKNFKIHDMYEYMVKLHILNERANEKLIEEVHYDLFKLYTKLKLKEFSDNSAICTRETSEKIKEYFNNPIK